MLSGSFADFDSCVATGEGSTAANCYRNIGKIFGKALLIEEQLIPVSLSMYLRQRMLGNNFHSLSEYLASIMIDDQLFFKTTMLTLNYQGDDVFKDYFGFDGNEFFYNKIYSNFN